MVALKSELSPELWSAGRNFSLDELTVAVEACVKLTQLQAGMESVNTSNVRFTFINQLAQLPEWINTNQELDMAIALGIVGNDRQLRTQFLENPLFAVYQWKVLQQAITLLLNRQKK